MSIKQDYVGFSLYVMLPNALLNLIHLCSIITRVLLTIFPDEIQSTGVV